VDGLRIRIIIFVLNFKAIDKFFFFPRKFKLVRSGRFACGAQMGEIWFGAALSSSVTRVHSNMNRDRIENTR
jgi:hypothetical protein